MERKKRTQELLAAYANETNQDIKRDIENEIIILNEALCAEIIWQYRSVPLEKEDAMQVARLSMLKAIRAYNGKYQFSTLAVTLMKNDLLNIQKTSQRAKRTATVLSLDKPYGDGRYLEELLLSNENVANETADRQLVREIFKEVPKLLNEKEYKVFLFAIEHTKHSRESLAEELNIRADYVSVIKRNALKKIRKRFSHAT